MRIWFSPVCFYWEVGVLLAVGVQDEADDAEQSRAKDAGVGISDGPGNAEQTDGQRARTSWRNGSVEFRLHRDQ
jgi:hypothetical protein